MRCMKNSLALCVLLFSSAVVADGIWKEVMPHTAVVKIKSSNMPEFFGYSTVTLVAKGITPDKKNIYVFLGAAHSLNRDHKAYSPKGPLDVDEIFAVEYMRYDDLGRGIDMASISETDTDATFHVDGDSELDVGLLTIIMTKELHITPANLICEAVADRLELGQIVYTGSAPCFPLVTFRTGTISLIPNDKVFMIDSGIAPGASGGGVYNEDGKYIGMITSMVCSNFTGAVVPMTTIYDFFRSRKLNFSTMCGDDEDVGKDSVRDQQGVGRTSGRATDCKKPGSDRGGVGGSDGEAAKEEEEKEEGDHQEGAGEDEEKGS